MSRPDALHSVSQWFHARHAPAVLAAPWLVSLFGIQHNQAQKIERWVGHGLVAVVESNSATTNRVSTLAVEEILPRRQGRGGACGRMPSHGFWDDDWKNKNMRIYQVVALDGRQLTN